jgi:hypothetical protein
MDGADGSAGAVSSEEELEFRRIVQAFGEAGFVPMLLAPALIVVSPLSGIPLLPTLFGTMIALISLQMLLGRRHLWLPEMLMRRRIRGRQLHSALLRTRGFGRWIDRHARDRLSLLVRPPLDVVPKALCMLCGAAMPFLELVPFSSSLLAAAVVLMGTGMLARDGLFTLAAGGFIGIAAMVPLLVYGGLMDSA